MKATLLTLAILTGLIHQPAWAQDSDIIERGVMDALIVETSGRKALDHFDYIQANYSGFSPSQGSEDMSAHIADQARSWGLSDVKVEMFPSNGRDFFWAFKLEPWWEGRKAEIWLLKPQRRRIASFAIHRSRLARFSRNASLISELVYVGTGNHSADYEGLGVAGKIVIASGRADRAHELAVWKYGAAGVIAYRNTDTAQLPDVIDSLQIVPREGPQGQPPGFLIALS